MPNQAKIMRRARKLLRAFEQNRRELAAPKKESFYIRMAKALCGKA